MERLFVGDDGIDEPFPSFAIEDAPRLDGFFDEACALCKDAPGAQGIVTDFAVAHIGIARHADVCAVSEEMRFDGFFIEHIEDGSASQEDGIAFVAASFADAIEYDDEDGTFGTDRLRFF